MVRALAIISRGSRFKFWWRLEFSSIQIATSFLFCSLQNTGIHSDWFVAQLEEMLSHEHLLVVYWRCLTWHRSRSRKSLFRLKKKNFPFLCSSESHIICIACLVKVDLPTLFQLLTHWLTNICLQICTFVPLSSKNSVHVKDWAACVYRYYETRTIIQCSLIEHEHIIYKSSNCRMKQLVDWLVGSCWTFDSSCLFHTLCRAAKGSPE